MQIIVRRFWNSLAKSRVLRRTDQDNLSVTVRVLQPSNRIIFCLPPPKSFRTPPPTHTLSEGGVLKGFF